MTGVRGIAAILMGLASPLMAAQDEPVEVPSGMPVAFHEMLLDAAGDEEFARFRFVAPQIGGDTPRSYEEVAADMDFLCNSYALPRLSEVDTTPAHIVVSLMAEPVEFGAPAPGIPQYFEAYALDGGACIWEAF